MTLSFSCEFCLEFEEDPKKQKAEVILFAGADKGNDRFSGQDVG